MGTVIAYDCLKRVAECAGVDGFIVPDLPPEESADFEAITAEDWDRVQAVNLRAPFLLTRAAAPLLRERKGVVVNIADLSGVQATWQRFVHHGVSKAGLIHLTKTTARVLAPDVRVNCIIPGTVLPPEA